MAGLTSSMPLTFLLTLVVSVPYNPAAYTQISSPTSLEVTKEVVQYGTFESSTHFAEYTASAKDPTTKMSAISTSGQLGRVDVQLTKTAETQLPSTGTERAPATSTSTIAKSSTSTSYVIPVKQDSWIEDLQLTTKEVPKCMTSSGTYEYKALRGAINFIVNRTGKEVSAFACIVMISAPPDLVIKVQTIELAGNCMNSGRFKMFLFDGVRIKHLANTAGEILPPVFTFTEKVAIDLRAIVLESCTIRLNFTAVPQSARPHLELFFGSHTEGYIQTPGFDGHTLYPPNMDSWVRVDVPDHHAVMTSFQHLDVEGATMACTGHSVALYTGGNKSENVVRSACTEFRPLPQLYKTNVFFVRFVSDALKTLSGFKLILSFLNDSALPEKLPDGKWNCSIPYFASFQQHFRCDVNQDCAGAEDEAGCEYASVWCGPGLVSVGERCYRLVVQETTVGWTNASHMCRLGGANLVSLNTPSEWRDVTKVLNKLNYNIFIGLKTASSTLPNMYRNCLQWSDGTVAYFLHADRTTDPEAGPTTDLDECGFIIPQGKLASNLAVASVRDCLNADLQIHILCEIDRGVDGTRIKAGERTDKIQLTGLTTWTSNVSHVVCPNGHVTHEFLSCDMQSGCWGHDYGSCDAPVTPLPPEFTCANGVERVPYTLVCDFRSDCRDASDEDFCVFPPCDVIKDFSCGNQQCVPKDILCDKVENCINGVDEERCEEMYKALDYNAEQQWRSPPPPARVDFDGRGKFSVKVLINATCPETHFQCPRDGYCLPVYVRCNGVNDCPGKEDEAACDGYTCPGFYRCRASKVCLHPDHVCDGVFQCPQRDDELVCDIDCPENCTCYGLAVYCPRVFPVHLYPSLRYLNARGSGLRLEDVRHNTMLVYLSLADCGLTTLHAVHLPNLYSLDLSHNRLVTLSVNHLVNLPLLTFLSLASNPLAGVFVTQSAPDQLDGSVLPPSTPDPTSVSISVKVLDLSYVSLPVLDVSVLNVFPDVQKLNLSHCAIQRVLAPGFQALPHLRELDLRRSAVSQFPREIIRSLNRLQSVYADNYKLCCPDTLPVGFPSSQCRAPTDEISSCHALLRSNVYRLVLSLFAVLALLGNLATWLYRVLILRSRTPSGFGVLVTHLCVADFLMGVYLAVVGVADRLYQGVYLWQDDQWKSSMACQLAGFLALLSSEVSAFMICLITLDRLLVFCFPFSAARLHPRSAHAACVTAWGVGLVLAGIPLLPVTSHWRFYAQTGICLPLPITRSDFPGRDYSTGVMIGLNFVLFILIAVGQVIIFWSVRASSITSSAKSKDLTIARRLFTVVLTDFLCWFPIGLLGLLAATGTAVPGEVSVAMAIVVLPLNSALNPFLYTINAAVDRRRRAKEKRLQQALAQSTATSRTATVSSGAENTSKPGSAGNATQEKGKTGLKPSQAWGLFVRWMSQGLLNREDVLKYAYEGGGLEST